MDIIAALDTNREQRQLKEVVLHNCRLISNHAVASMIRECTALTMFEHAGTKIESGQLIDDIGARLDAIQDEATDKGIRFRLRQRIHTYNIDHWREERNGSTNLHPRISIEWFEWFRS